MYLSLSKSFNILIQSLLEQEASSSFNKMQLSIQLIPDDPPGMPELPVTGKIPANSSLGKVQLLEFFHVHLIKIINEFCSNLVKECGNS